VAAGLRRFRLSDVLASLSYALDLTEGQPAGHTLRACLIGMRFAEELGQPPDARASLYYTLLIKDAGCSSNSAALAAMLESDDQTSKRDLKSTDWTSRLSAARYTWRNAKRGGTLAHKAKTFGSIVRGQRGGARELIRVRCERGSEIASRPGFPPATASAVLCLDEHWDGRGHPAGVAGDSIPFLSRIALLAQTIEVHLSDGVDSALDIVRRRRGRWFDPELAARCLRWRGDRAWRDGLSTPDAARVVSLDPADGERYLEESELDHVAEAFADIIDAKTPYTYRHSSEVARYARGIARTMGTSLLEQQRLYRAGLLHDIGKLGVWNRILDKPGRLDDEEVAIVRRHPAHTWEVLRNVGAFADFAWTSALHHERLDGNGYPWGIDRTGLDRAARILAVADIYEALTADRPYRGGMTSDAAFAILDAEGGSGVDSAVVHALRATLESTDLLERAS
jgi:HD-GYP domain-containing protein (c-di-GMP phosphodiesterase class II)